MQNNPSAVASQVLDAIGSSFVLGDISEGSREAQVILRAYGQCLRQLLRGANWDFARKTAPLFMLADATGQTPDVGRVVPSGYLYEYAYPDDCMKVRFVQRNHLAPQLAIPPGNIAIGQARVIVPNVNANFPGARPRPARFVIAMDSNYVPPVNVLSEQTQGVGQNSRTVILTDVNHAHCTYTALVLDPSQWDSLFRAALVAYIASEVALPLTEKKPFGLQIRNEQIMIAKTKIEAARLVDGNEAVTSTDIPVDWMNARRSGGGFRRVGVALGGDGFGGAAWDACSFADGSAY
jgi:hypothetical protein